MNSNRMKKAVYTLLLSTIILFSQCTEEDNGVSTGTVEIKFDNVVGDIQAGLLANPGNEDYPYTTVLGQQYNLTLVKYIVSEIVLEGPDGAYYADELSIAGDDVNGYYLIDESNLSSQTLTVDQIAPGVYDQISFKIGIEEEGVDQGASIILDGMFWAWSSGYIGMKVEGQSSSSAGESFGDTIEETNPHGFGYHIGGWKSPNNVREVTIAMDEIRITPDYKPEIHLVIDIAKFLDGGLTFDFSKRNSIHDAATGAEYADNIPGMFRFDHVHNNPL
ncbi:hypothetical protein SAMN04488028_109110 [Reichenbachiella agariperforans]|uniref:Copper-binding protein MbnP-like domain-containing protein n=2 Tax=Reichenbachiella agariperforans TaxID=156994 RepID=A0A1M6VMC1_REIAG|nr:hypothetical protein SAMN04488028_109110 [Reichenbachiella agariperforans]